MVQRSPTALTDTACLSWCPFFPWPNPVVARTRPLCERWARPSSTAGGAAAHGACAPQPCRPPSPSPLRVGPGAGQAAGNGCPPPGVGSGAQPVAERVSPGPGVASARR